MRKRFRLPIKTPCSADWEKMNGDDVVRFCETCQLSVFNISAMTDKDAAKAIKDNSSRMCARVWQRPDGSTYTDNCPYHMRRLRNAMRRYAPALLALVAWGFHQS